MKTFTLAALAALAAPLSALAHGSAQALEISEATAPVGTLGPTGSELASFVLAAAALVVAGIALARTRHQS